MLSLGIIETAPAPLPSAGPTGARYCEVNLVPEDHTISARVANAGQGEGRGVFALPRVGDEVLVFFPDGDMQAAVIFAGVGSLAAPNPTSNTGDQILILHPGGVELKTQDAAQTEGVVLRSLVNDLRQHILALEVMINAMITASAAPGGYTAAASAYFATLQETPQIPTEFSRNLTTSAAAGAPYVAPNIKAGQ